MATTSVFKVTAVELDQQLLALDRFQSIDDAVHCIAHCLTNLQSPESVRAQHAYQYEHVHEALYTALVSTSLLTECHVLVTLRNIRQWALEGLRNESLLQNLSQRLTIPNDEPKEASFNEPKSFPNYQSATKSFSPIHARSVLANAFLGNCRDPMGPFKDRWNQGGLDFLQLLMASPHKRTALERFKCLFLYLEGAAALSEEEEQQRQIVFQLVRFVPLDFSNLEKLSSPADDRYVGDRAQLHNGRMEDPPRSCGALVNFANANFGYGKFIGSATQEEILLSVCPELALGMLFLGRMNSNEVVLVHGVRRYVQYSGYAGSFTCHGLDDDVVSSNAVQTILTMDACFKDHFHTTMVARDVSKAYYAFCAFRDHSTQQSLATTISTGKWGSGVFGGLACHKFLQQLVAATMAGVDYLSVSTFGNDEDCSVVLEILQRKRTPVSLVLRALKTFQDPKTFVKDVTAFLEREEGNSNTCNIS